MSRKYKIRDQDKLYFVTFTVIHWLDVFIRREYQNTVIFSWTVFVFVKRTKDWKYVLMLS